MRCEALCTYDEHDFAWRLTFWEGLGWAQVKNARAVTVLLKQTEATRCLHSSKLREPTGFFFLTFLRCNIFLRDIKLVLKSQKNAFQTKG